MSVYLSGGSTPPAIKHLPLPFEIAIDNKETLPYRFTGFTACHQDAQRYRDKTKKQTIKKATGLPLYVLWKTCHLRTGDYSIVGMEKLVTIERKTLTDFYGSLGGKGGERRSRLAREHERMSKMVFAAVIIEANWTEIFASAPEYSKLTPRSVHRTMCSWQQRYGVPWLAMADRRLAEITTFRILEKFWREQNGIS